MPRLVIVPNSARLDRGRAAELLCKMTKNPFPFLERDSKIKSH